jgi:FkbM family methyltransferase
MKYASRFVIPMGNRIADCIAPSPEPLSGLMRRLVLIGWSIEGILVKPDFPYYMVDVGACVGSWGVTIAWNHPNASVLCLEPVPASFACLKYNSRSLPNLRAINIAASDRHETIKLSYPDLTEFLSNNTEQELIDNYGLYTNYGLLGKETIEVEAHPLDSVVDRKVHLLKIDVEGMERRVLDGAQRILTKDRPIMQIEMIDRNQKRNGGTVVELKKYIVSYGYKLVGTDAGDAVYIPEELIR